MALARSRPREDGEAVKAIVLVKQVPDVRASPVGVNADGTIDRRNAATITNPADLHAAEAALHVADEVIALSMGPLQAEDALREAVSMGADRGVLLCDRILAGSDTWATANALAAAIGALGGADIVVCGMTALDGETGQVGPSVAQRLGWAQATGCEEVEVQPDHLVVRRIVEGGFERVRVPLPAVLTVAETGFLPRYPTVVGRRAAATAEIERLSAADVGVDASLVGLAASPTKVAHMEPTALPDRSCRFVGSDGFDYDDLATALVELGAVDPVALPPSDAAFDRTLPPVAERTDAAPSIWVVTESRNGRLLPVSVELLSKATELAPGLGGSVAAVIATDGTGSEADEAAEYGADVVIAVESDELAPYRTEPHARVVAELAVRHRPAAVLFGATTAGRDLAPRVASMLDTGLAADCTDLTVATWERRGERYEQLLHQVRPAMGGGVLATCVCPERRPQMATVRPGVFVARRNPKQARLEEGDVEFAPSDLRVEVLSREIGHADFALAEADVVIAGGAGCDSKSWHLLEELAASIGGRVAASRAAVEAGLAPRSSQVGQTGTSVHPRLYVACGISGALQHTVGMHAARTVVAVNRDPGAFIFGLAHFGIVGDVADVVPRLSAAIAARSTTR